MAEALKKLKMPLFIGCLKILRDNNKTHISDIMLEEELLKYMRLKRITKYELSKLFNNLIKGCGKDVRYIEPYDNLKKYIIKANPNNSIFEEVNNFNQTSKPEIDENILLYFDKAIIRETVKLYFTNATDIKNW